MSRTTEKMMRDMVKQCIQAMEDAHESLFLQCLSNPLKNYKGDTINTLKVNNLLSVANEAKAVLMSHEGSHPL